MKVKQTLNNSVSAFDFTFDLSDGAYMSKILSLYNIQDIYLCIYDLHIETELLISSLKKIT